MKITFRINPGKTVYSVYRGRRWLGNVWRTTGNRRKWNTSRPGMGGWPLFDSRKAAVKSLLK